MREPKPTPPNVPDRSGAPHVDYLKRCQYLEERIEQLAQRSGQVQVNDNGTWQSVTEWAESVIRGDDVVCGSDT